METGKKYDAAIEIVNRCFESLPYHITRFGHGEKGRERERKGEKRRGRERGFKDTMVGTEMVVKKKLD